jgi:FlaA1/EpsC-like NDP-sugar epimerase
LLMRGLGYRKQTSFKTALSLAQVSEFSLILLFLAKRLGHIDDTIISLVTLVAIITYVISSYTALNLDAIYKNLKSYLGIFEQKHPVEPYLHGTKDVKDHIVLIGANRLGMSIVKKLKTHSKDLVVVDFDPSIAAKIEGLGAIFISGDVTSPDIQEIAQLGEASVVVSTIPNVEDNLILTAAIKKLNPKVKIIVSVHQNAYAETLYKAGVDHVVFPYSFVGNSLGNIIKKESYDKLSKFNSL